jgi:hypothetical protein
MMALQPESDLWQANLDALRWAVTLRKPDAIARLKLQVDRLDGEISALVCRRSYVDDGTVLGRRLTTQIYLLLDRMEDLRAIGDLVRASPLDHDDGANPEQAAKANVLRDEDGIVREIKNHDPGTDDLSSELKRAAEDVRHGWAVITQRAGYSAMGRQPGTGDVGARQEALRRQYLAWVAELHRKRMGTWAADDVVCEGLSRTACARKRCCSAEAVYDRLVAGLALYAEMWPPLGEG